MRTGVAVAAAAAGAVGLGVFAGAAPMADVLGWATLLVAGTALALATRRWPHLRTPVLLGLAARVVLALVQVYVMPLPASGEDDLWMEEQGWLISQLSPDQRFETFGTGSRAYSWMIGWLYAFTDRSPLMIGGLNVLLGTLLIVVTARLAQTLWGEREARTAAWITAGFPMLMLLSAITLREMAVTFPFTVGVLYLVRWQKTERVAPLAAGLGFVLLSAGFHSVIVFTLVGLVLLLALRALSAASHGRMRALLRLALALTLAGVAGLIIVRAGWGLDKFGSIQGITEERLAQVQEVSQSGRSSYLTGLRMDSPVDVVVQLPLRAVFFLFAPFPWMARSAADLFGVLDAALYVVLAFLAFRALRTPGAMWQARPLLVMGGIVLAVFAASVSNYGTAVRHRGKTAPLIVALAAGGTRRSLAARRRGSLPPELAPGPVPPPAGVPVPAGSPA